MSTRTDGTKLRQYWIVLNFIDLSSLANQAEDLKTAVRINRETRFAFLDLNTLDSKRLILYASTTFLKQHGLMYLDEAVQKFCRDKFPFLTKSLPEILLSLKDGPVQERHTDYCVDSLEDIEIAKLCRFCILAISGTSSIMVYRSNGYGHKEIQINAGDLFIGRGSLIHNGMSYQEDNLRIHWYIDFPGKPRVEDVTYPFGLDLQDYHNSRCPNPCAEFREQEKKKKDYNKERMKKLNNLKWSRQSPMQTM